MRSDYFLMATTFISRIFGIVRMMVVASIFGGGASADIINFAFNIPNNLRKLFAEGAFSEAFVPMLSRVVQEEQAEMRALCANCAPEQLCEPHADRENIRAGSKARSLMQDFLGWQLLFLVIIVGAAIMWAPQFIEAISSYEGTQAREAVAFFRLIIGYILLIGVVTSMKGALQSLELYRDIGINPILFSIAVIPMLLLLHKAWGIYAMAAGIMVGGLLQLIGMLYPFVHRGYSLMPALRLHNPQLKGFMLKWMRISMASIILIINQQIALSLATPLRTGSVTALSNAIILWQLPYGIFVASIITVCFPRFSKEGLENRSQTLLAAILKALFYMLPASLLLYFGARELVAVVLQHGAYTLEQADLTARVLRAYAVSIVPYLMYQHVIKYLMATDREKISLVASLMLCILDIVFSLVLRETTLEVAGLAWAHAISTTLIFLVLCYVLRGEFSKSSISYFVHGLMRRILSILPMLAVLLLYAALSPAWWTAHMFIRIGLLSLCGMGALLLVYISYKIEPPASIAPRQ